ncbi:hypothetical protein C8R44DRAFT_741847 [Mycena epipterygia]|nr:hypothetical protein C8R44DRAFT_741847 [Mycena epipterygia]
MQRLLKEDRTVKQRRHLNLRLVPALRGCMRWQQHHQICRTHQSPRDLGKRRSGLDASRKALKRLFKPCPGWASICQPFVGLLIAFQDMAEAWTRLLKHFQGHSKSAAESRVAPFFFFHGTCLTVTAICYASKLEVWFSTTFVSSKTAAQMSSVSDRNVNAIARALLPWPTLIDDGKGPGAIKLTDEVELIEANMLSTSAVVSV